MNEKQEIFIREYLKDFNGTRAYKEAYESKDDKVAATGAWRMLRNVDIQQEIQKQANKQLEEVDIDVNYIIGNIKEVTERCMKQNEYGEFDAKNSLKGLELLGKYKSIFSDNIKLSGNVSNEKQKNAIDDVISQMKPPKEDDT